MQNKPWLSKAQYKKHIKNLNKQQVTAVFNYSSLVLTEHMEQLLNLGLNFAILPLKLDITQILVDYKKYERSLVWHEFWYGREDAETKYEPPMFKTNKTNFPKNYTVPEGLKVMIGAVKSEIMDPMNRNKVSCNIGKDSISALCELINLQKQRRIVIKRCDKGAGIIVLDFQDYMIACNAHLNSKLKRPDGSTTPYYTKAEEKDVENAKDNLKNLIEEAKDNDIITKEESKAICPEGKTIAKFYCTFKIHKDHAHGETPPERPIVSGCGSIFENASKFVEHHISKISNTHPTYLQDTPDFLRCIDKINKEGKLSKKTLLATFDVIGLFTNIPKEEGLEALKEGLEERTEKEVPTEFLVRLMRMILENNFFQFDETRG